MTKAATDFRVRGLVQGVGFRPTVYRIALELGLSGTVWNDAEGVVVHLEGEPEVLERFPEAPLAGKPPLARIDAVEPAAGELQGMEGFSISATPSGGRVTMECLATNSIVPTTEMLQAVSNGTLDCAQTAATNFSDDSLGILSTLPVGMTFDEYMGWYIAGEGQQVLDEVMAQIDSNIVAFPCGVVDSEILYHSTKPIKCLDDIKGLKIRGVSDWANIETRLGASVVTMDGGDCYEALSHGTIDAAEYSSPSANWAAGFQEVAPYLTVPGVHQSCSVYLFLINRNIWDGLDAQTQNIIKLACTAMMAQNWAEDRAANGKAWEQFRELEAQGKLTIYRMPDEDLDKIQEVAQEYYEEKCAANPLFEKIYRSQQAYIASVSDWSEAATAK